jgi:protein-S-isoprenylcysteine O-methyltransferase Ste14
MPIWGVGPAVGVPTACYGLAAGAATFVWPSASGIGGLPYPWLAVLGGLLLAMGAAWYAIAVRTVRSAYREERLVTDGVYAVCRHPIYAGWILLILPAIGLLLNSWPVLSMAVVMYVLTRIHVRREEQSLEAQFGDRYADYKRRTNALFPTFARRR